MAPFGVIGAYLRGRYLDGILVTVDQSGNELVVADGMFPVKPPRDDLVFLEESPDYCVPNSNTGSLGTTGRACNKTTLGHGSCGILCCGRGFNTIQVEEEYRCQCKFHWCCYVKCNTCRRTVDKHVCKPPEDDADPNNGGPQISGSVASTDSNSHNRPPKKSSNKQGKGRKNRKNKKRDSPSTSLNSLSGGDRTGDNLW